MNMLSWIVDGSFPTRLTVALLHFIWQGCAGGIVVIVGGWLLHGAEARSRYSLNAAVMLLMAACLPTTFFLQNSPDAGGDRSASVRKVQQPPVSPWAHSKLLVPDEERAVPAAPEVAGSDEPLVIPSPEVATSRTSPEVGSTRLSPTAWLSSASSSLRANAFPTLSRWVAAVYLTGVALTLGRLLRGVWGGHRLRKMASAVEDPVLLEMVRNQAHRLGLKVVPTVAWCKQISIPVVVGIVTPMILLPTAVVSGLTPSQLQALMLHELSHIRRFDPIVNLLQRVIEAMLFFHPVVWFVSRRVSIEREHAADDMVLAAGWDRPGYADALVRVAELASAISGADAARRATVLGAAGTKPSEFKLRILRLLGHSDPPRLDMSRAAILALLLFVAMGGMLAWSQIDVGGPQHSDQSKSADVTPGTIEFKIVDGGKAEYEVDGKAEKEVGEVGSEPQPASKRTAPPANNNPTLENGLQEFQGTWSFDACESVLWYTPLNEIRESWKWAIEGREMTWTRAGKEPVRMTIKVDPTKEPKQINFTFLDGPHQGKTSQGIYEFERMNLWICMTEPGAEVPRPEKMAMSGTSQTALIILNRAPKNFVPTRKMDEAPPKPKPLANGSSLLQGTFNVEQWTSEKWPAQPDDIQKWQWSFEGQEVTWTRPGLETVRLSFTFDSGKPLPEIDFTFLDGPDKGQKCRGIYLASRHEIAICFQDPGESAERPKWLGSNPESHHTALTLVAARIPSVAEEVEALSGQWKFNIYYSDWWPARISNPPFSKEAWRWSIQGNEIVWTGMKIDDVRLSFTLDPSKSPRQIDLTILDGPYKGKKLHGIYEFGFGSSVDICVADPDANADRPTVFGYSTGAGHTWLSLKKVAGD